MKICEFFRPVILALMVASMAVLSGCGQDASREECFERIAIPYNGTADGDMRNTGNEYCRNKGFDKATWIEGYTGRIVRLCCEKNESFMDQNPVSAR